jgi:hypothetical protein
VNREFEMRMVAGILLLLAGIAYPMAALLWLNRWLARGPLPASQSVGLVLAFNGIFPVVLVGLAAGLLSARLWAMLSYRYALLFASLVCLGMILALGWKTTAQRQR